MHRVEHVSMAILDSFKCDATHVELTPDLAITRIDTFDGEKYLSLLGRTALDEISSMNPPNVIQEGYRLREAAKRGIEWIGGVPKLMETIPVRIRENLIAHRIAAYSNHALVWSVVAERPETKFETEHLYWFSDTLTALRLLKPGLVGRYQSVASTKWDEKESFLYKWPLPDSDYFLHPFPMLPNRLYLLDMANVTRLKELLLLIRKKESPRIRIALERFNRLASYTEIEIEPVDLVMVDQTNQIIDAMVAFEALYLKRREKSKKKKIAERVSKHLAPADIEKQRKIHTLITSAYKVRSDVVHGDLRKIKEAKEFQRGPWRSPSEMLRELSFVLRDALNSKLKNPTA